MGVPDRPSAAPDSTPQEPAGRPASPWWFRALTRVGRIVVLVYVGLLLFLGVFQRTLLYHPSRAESITLADSGLAPTQVSEVVVPGHDGLPLRGWLALASPAKEPSQIFSTLRSSALPLIVYFQGNAGNRVRNAGIVRELTSAGFHVLYVDYRGFGINPGSPSESDLVQDGRAVWDFTREVLQIPSERILLFGESLGGGVATAVARSVCLDHQSPAGLILGSTFSSVRGVASRLYPIFPVRLMLLDPFLSSERIADVTCPLLQFHGTADSIVPIESGRELFRAMPLRSRSGIEKRYVEIAGGEHYDIPSTTLRDELQAFAKHCGCVTETNEAG